MSSFDFVVIGSGPGGYTGAIRAAQLGYSVAIIEKDPTLGGTCLNVGCIPSKVMLESSEHYATAKKGQLQKHGVETSTVSLNLNTLLKRKDSVVKELTQGVAFLMKKNKVQVIQGKGKFVSTSQIEITNKENKKATISFKKALIATGSVPNSIPGVTIDEDRVVSSTGALSLSPVPKKLIVIGAGYIGLELGSVWNKLGSEVHVLEYANGIAGTMDKDAQKALKKSLEKQGIKFHLGVAVQKTTAHKSKVEVEYKDLSTNEVNKTEADIVLVSTGRKAFTEGLGLENIGIELNKQNQIPVNGYFQTTAGPHIFAIGDVIDGPMLAHKAEEEGVAAAEISKGLEAHVNYLTVPGIIYTHPEVASVGLTEQECKEQGMEYNIGQFPFAANGRAKALADTEGFVKIISDKKTDKILGGHIVHARASDLIGEIVISMERHSTAKQLAHSFHGHPTLSEAIREAALATNKLARQM